MDFSAVLKAINIFGSSNSTTNQQQQNSQQQIPKTPNIDLAWRDLDKFPSEISVLNESVERIDASNNRLRSLEQLRNFPRLNELILDSNAISEHSTIPTLSSVVTISLNKNQFKNLILCVEKLSRSFPNLVYLSLLFNDCCPQYYNFSGNPTKESQDYRCYVIAALPRLKVLDHIPILEEERIFANKLYGKMRTTNQTPVQYKHPIQPHKIFHSSRGGNSHRDLSLGSISSTSGGAPSSSSSHTISSNSSTMTLAQPPKTPVSLPPHKKRPRKKKTTTTATTTTTTTNTTSPANKSKSSTSNANNKATNQQTNSISNQLPTIPITSQSSMPPPPAPIVASIQQQQQNIVSPHSGADSAQKKTGNHSSSSSSKRSSKNPPPPSPPPLAPRETPLVSEEERDQTSPSPAPSPRTSSLHTFPNDTLNSLLSPLVSNSNTTPQVYVPIDSDSSSEDEKVLASVKARQVQSNVVLPKVPSDDAGIGTFALPPPPPTSATVTSSNDSESENES